jgi:UDP-N-acetylmuramoyl-tripeptide--D-alanyl-D-alanine ligase
LVEGLSAGGVAILNADDAAVDAMASRTAARVLRFGSGPQAEVRSEDVRIADDGRATFRLVMPGGDALVRLPVPGEHLVSDALAAAAAGYALGISAPDAARGLEATSPPPLRMQVSGVGGWTMIDDSYNANPASTAAALKTLARIGRGRRTWAVLGVMAELGDQSPLEHDRMGRLAVRLGVARLIAVGDEARPMLEAARLEGMTPEEAVMVSGVDDALALLRSAIEPGDVVLVKASRAAGLERLTAALREEAGR